MAAQNIQQYQLTVPSENEMYKAITDRDSVFDGLFYFGVVTTSVFCKPSCGARLANRENIRFFLDTESAVDAGFRACKKCHPENLQHELEMLVAVAKYIEVHSDDQLTLNELSKQAKLSPSHFQKLFKSAFGVSPKEYQDASRLGRLKDELKKGGNVTSAIFSAGYGSSSRVYGESSRTMGMTPVAYRDGGDGEEIFYAHRNSSLGHLLMAATARGVCFAQFGSGFKPLLEQLQSEFPKASLMKSPKSKGPELDNWIDALKAHLDQRAPRPDLPLDLRGTAFQLSVWRFLLSVNEGDVISYSELAQAIDKPKAFRAAATACGTNRVGVLVPCHRVLRGNGDLGGYRWGEDRKRTLLDMERRARASA